MRGIGRTGAFSRGRATSLAAPLFGILTVVGLTTARAADWPQWRGPQRNGVAESGGWTYKWPASGPRKLWGARLGEGFSSVAVKGGRLYTMGNSGNQDAVFCFNAENGKPIWRTPYPCAGGDYGGPRATPTVEGNRVYTFSRAGQAYCFDAANGHVIWNVDLVKVAGAQVPRWGFASSPLIDGPRVIYNAGGAGTALDKATGRVLWKSPGGTAGYSSPVPFSNGGQAAVALFTSTGLAAVGPVSGHRLWEFPWKTSYEVNAADPLFLGGDVFVSSNYDTGCARLRLGRGRPAVVWQNKNMRNHFNTCVVVGDALYGNDQGTLKCLDARSGAERWQLRGIGKGGLITSGGNLIVLTERGEVVVARATPASYQELARAKVLGGTCWTHPVLVNGRLYCRSHEGDLVCLDVRAPH